MKYKILIIIITIFPFFGQSQQQIFDLLIDKPGKDVFIGQTIEDNQNNFILVGTYTDYTNRIPKLFKISPTGDIVFETDFGINKNIVLTNIYEIEGSYLITGENMDKQTFFLMKCDNNFNSVWQKEYRFFGNDTIVSYKSLINANSELVLSGVASTQFFYDENIFTAKINFEGVLIFFKYYPYQHDYQIIWDIDEIPGNNGYLISGYHFNNPSNFMECEIVKLDKNLHIVDVQRIIAENFPWDALWGNSAISFFSDTTFLFASRKIFQGLPQDEDINVQLLDTSLNLLKEVSWGKIDTVEYFPRNGGIDYMYKDAIYVGGISPLNFSSATINWNMITKLDENLNIKWTKFYGGDASYNLRNVFATQDGGLIITGTRITATLPNYDTFIIKIDSAGNTSFTTSINDNIQIFTKNIIVYPNPSNGIINFQKGQQIKNATIKIYDITGKFITEKEFNENQLSIDLTGHKTGTYFYNIVSKNKIIDNGKFILID